MKSRYLSRSQDEQARACERAAYYRYLWDGTGLDSPTPDDRLALGIAVHAGLEAFFLGAKKEDALKRVGEVWEREMGPPPDDKGGSEIYREIQALGGMLIAGWLKVCAPDFVRRFEPLKVEEEIEYPLTGEGSDGESGVEGHAAQSGKDEGAGGEIPVRLFTRPRYARETAQVVEPRKRRSHSSRDLHGKRERAAGIKPGLSPSEPSLILQTKADLIVRERESGNLFVINWKTTQDRDLYKSYAYSSQMWTEALAAAKHMGEDVAGTILIGFYKGQRRKGRYTSALLKGYNGQDIQGWIDNVPIDVLKEQFLESPPIPYDEKVVEGWLRQVVSREEQTSRTLRLYDEPERETFFFQRFGSQCNWCPFIDICMQRTRPETMLKDGLLKRRVDHHARPA